MAAKTKKEEIKLSEFQLKQNQGQILSATMQCWLPEPAELSLLLLDEKGRVYLRKNELLPSGKNLLEINLDNLGTGSYRAWIEWNGKNFIRPLTIVRPPDPSWFQRLKEMIFK
ncbi:MAG: hypothetical protein AAFZ15_31370 [Bacteroidota bacterium]